MKLQTRILAGYLVSSLLILALGATILFTIYTVSPIVDELDRDVAELGQAVLKDGQTGKIVSLRSELSRSARQFVQSKEIGFMRQYDRAHIELLEVFAQAIETADNKDEAKIYINLRDASLKLAATEQRMIRLTIADKIDEARAAGQSVAYDELNGAISDFIATLANKKHVQSTDIFSKLIDVSRSTQINRQKLGNLAQITVIVVILILVASIVVGVAISRSISRPLTHLEARAVAFGEGDLGSRTNFNRSDEIGQLSAAFDQMADNLETTMKERDAAEQNLNILNNELEQRVQERTERIKQQQDELLQFHKMEALGNLTAGIAHNLNNFLQPIGMSSELMLKNLTEDSPDRKSIERIIRSADKAANLVKQLMTFSRQQSSDKSSQPILPVIEEVVAMAEKTLPKTAKIQMNLDRFVGNVILNESQIQTVILNLLSNAVDALQERVGEITITLSEKKNNVCITVSDTGIGMKDEVIERIFDPFFTTKKIGQGTGLGLSTAQRTVKDHGGTINCSSSLGKGTAFEVLLPLASENQITENVI